MVISSIKILPDEILLQIFTYLEASQLKRAFEKLNSLFESLLHSPHLRVYVQARKNDLALPLASSSTFAYLPIHSIRALTAGRARTGCLLRFVGAYVSDLVHLYSITVRISRDEQINMLKTLIVHLPHLQRLSISCSDIVDSNLVLTISPPQLRRLSICLQCLWNYRLGDIQSNEIISHLIMKEQIDRKSFLTILKHLPFLRSFDVAMDQPHDVDHSFWKDIHLSCLKSATFRSNVRVFQTSVGCTWCAWYKDSDYLLQTASQLQSLTFHFHLNEKNLVWSDEDMFDEWGWSHLLENRTICGHLIISPFGKKDRIFFENRALWSPWFSTSEIGRKLHITVKRPFNQEENNEVPDS